MLKVKNAYDSWKVVLDTGENVAVSLLIEYNEV